MTRSTIISAVAILAMTASSSSAFVPSARKGPLTFLPATAATHNMPYFIDVAPEHDTTSQQNASVQMMESTKPSAPVAPKKKPAAAGAKHQDGLFSPVVKAAKVVLGEEKLNKVRGKVIGMHSDVIGNFVDTYDWPTGKVALKVLFQVADKDQSGTIDEKELMEAFHAIGFTFLKEKQMKGIFERADSDNNGLIDQEEFMKEAPKTLRTNLIKLAKKNGADLGFLV